MTALKNNLIQNSLVMKNNRIKILVYSFVISSLFTLLFALTLNLVEVPINVIIPSSAPVWMGTLTVGYMVQIEK